MARMAWLNTHHGEAWHLREHSHVLRNLGEEDGLQEVMKLFKAQGLFRSSETLCIGGNLFLLLYPRAIFHEVSVKKFSEEGQAEKLSKWELGQPWKRWCVCRHVWIRKTVPHDKYHSKIVHLVNTFQHLTSGPCYHVCHLPYGSHLLFQMEVL